MNTVTAIIPTWNRCDLLTAIIRNLQAQSAPPARILVIDNGSTDESAQTARSLGVEVVSLDRNYGFAVAVNIGIRESTTDFVFIVNNDVQLQVDWLGTAVAAAQETGAPFVVGKLLRSNQTSLDGSWDLVSCGAYAWRCGYDKADGPVWSTRRRIYWAPMTAALFRRSVFDRIGLLDTGFESYYEDVDLGVRCALYNVKGLYEPSAVAVHNSKTTLGRRAARVYFYSSRNQIYLLARYASGRFLRRYWWRILAGQVLSLLAGARQRNFPAALRGKLAGLQNWRVMRQSWSDVESQRLMAIFEESEQQILDLQRETGFDLYWRLYFRLIGKRA